MPDGLIRKGTIMPELGAGEFGGGGWSDPVHEKLGDMIIKLVATFRKLGSQLARYENGFEIHKITRFLKEHRDLELSVRDVAAILHLIRSISGLDFVVSSGRAIDFLLNSADFWSPSQASCGFPAVCMMIQELIATTLFLSDDYIREVDEFHSFPGEVEAESLTGTLSVPLEDRIKEAENRIAAAILDSFNPRLGAALMRVIADRMLEGMPAGKNH